MDKFDEDDGEEVSIIGQAKTDPLLEEHTIKGALDSGEPW